MKRRIWVLGAPIVAAAILVSVAVVFAASIGGSAVSEETVLFLRTDSAIGSIATAQGMVQQAAVVAEVQPDRAGMYIADARSAISAATDRLSQVDQGSNAAEALEIRYLDSATDTLEYLEAGDFAAADGVISGSLSSQYAELTGALSEIRDRQGAHLTLMGSQAESAAQLTRFAVGLGLPLLVAVLLFVRYRRRESQRILQEQVETERTLRTSRDDFIANVSHELRTPLTAVFGFAQLLDSGYIEDPNERDDLTRLIYGESGELVRMVEDLLTAARLTGGDLAYKLESVVVGEETEEVAEVFGRMGVDVTVAVDGGFLRADRLRFRQIVRNLLSNAARYGGEDIEVRGRLRGSVYELVVADNGAGVPPDALDSVFERFSQYEDASLARGGLGLGLSIVHTLLDDMGGSIRYERADGWSKFIVELPGAAPPAGYELPDRGELSAGTIGQDVTEAKPIAVVSTAVGSASALAGPAGGRPTRLDRNPVTAPTR